MGLINPVISSSHIFQSGSLREHISLLGSKPADFHFIMNELRLNAEIKSYEWFSFAHISWPTFSNLMSVPKAASAGFYSEEFHINSMRVLSGAGEWCSAQRWHWMGGGAWCTVFFGVSWNIIIFFWLHSPPPCCPSFLYKSRVTFSAVATIHFESYTFIFDFATTTHTQTRARLFVPAEPTVLVLLLPLLPLQKPITV